MLAPVPVGLSSIGWIQCFYKYQKSGLWRALSSFNRNWKVIKAVSSSFWLGRCGLWESGTPWVRDLWLKGYLTDTLELNVGVWVLATQWVVILAVLLWQSLPLLCQGLFWFWRLQKISAKCKTTWQIILNENARWFNQSYSNCIK